MSILEAILLGILQGATEFLPISSSGHLVLSREAFGASEPGLLFDIILHVGTLLAVIAYYRKDVWEVVTGLYDGVVGFFETKSVDRFARPEGARIATLTVIAMVPTGIIGIFLDKLLDPPEGADPVITPRVVAMLLLINGAVLFANRFLGRPSNKERASRFALWNITPLLAIAIGVAQGLAVTPGFSRSGLTITAALALGVLRVEAARFSFLLSIPAILAALVFKFDAQVFSGATGDELLAFGLGALTAGAVGYVCILILVEMLKKARFHHFSWYCWAVGLLGLWLL